MTADPSIAIRRATPGDAAALAALGVDTFVETFGHLYDPEDLAGFLAESLSVPAYTRLLEDPDIAIWLAAGRPDRLVGFVVAAPCKLPVAGLEPRAGEVRQLYVRATVQNRGLGSRLLVAALDWLAAQDRRPQYVGVWSLNHGAQRLYARFGFGKVGEYDFPVGRSRDREFILRRPG